jgi:hypothetical protein
LGAKLGLPLVLVPRPGAVGEIGEMRSAPLLLRREVEEVAVALPVVPEDELGNGIGIDMRVDELGGTSMNSMAGFELRSSMLSSSSVASAVSTLPSTPAEEGDFVSSKARPSAFPEPVVPPS